MSCRRKGCCDPLSSNFTILALILIILQFSRPRIAGPIGPVVDGADGVPGCGGAGLLPFGGFGLDNNLLFLIVFVLLIMCGCKGCHDGNRMF